MTHLRVRLYAVGIWWHSLSAWGQIFVAAGLLCVLELLIAWRLYPYLLAMVTS